MRTLPAGAYGPGNIVGTSVYGLALTGQVELADGWGLAWDAYGGAVRLAELETYRGLTEATGAYTFTPNAAAINALSAATTETFTVSVTDGTASTTTNLVVTLTAVNDTPTVTAPASFAVTEDVAGNLTYTGTPDRKSVV